MNKNYGCQFALDTTANPIPSPMGSGLKFENRGQCRDRDVKMGTRTGNPFPTPHHLRIYNFNIIKLLILNKNKYNKKIIYLMYLIVAKKNWE